jgi:tRNA pseudouridine38-40 synthase
VSKGSSSSSGHRSPNPPAVQTLKLLLEYDGTGFRGWARQPGQRTVEGVVRDALDRVFAQWSNLSVAGRTDTGVHARGQVVGLSVVGGPPVGRLPEALNAALPEDVSVRAAATAPAGFSARFHASSRSYRYIVLHRRHRAALDARRALWWPRQIDEAGLMATARLIVGEHDFRAFTPTETHHQVFVRRVAEASWERRGDELHFTITANAFLRHMVRTLVGTMLERGAEGLEELLAGAPRALAGLTAPPWGLYLERVDYAHGEQLDPD